LSTGSVAYGGLLGPRRAGHGGEGVRHHGRVDSYWASSGFSAFGRLSSAVYIAARTGTVDCTAAFDLAAEWLADHPQDPDATELASLSIDCAPASQPRLAEVALRLLATADFCPGFAEEPGWLACLEDAMRLVNRDVAATGIGRACRLRVYDENLGRGGNAYVETWDGYNGSAQGVFPESGADPVSGLVAVAEDAQDAIMHSLWAAWPMCPVHRLGVHAREHEGTGVWWCPGGGHAVAVIGEFPSLAGACGAPLVDSGLRGSARMRS
jgi:hypothetical protein